MNRGIIGISFIPAGITNTYMAALRQMYVVMTKTYTLNRFKDKELVWRVALLFISFSLAVYLLCPNSRKKGIVFFILGEGSATMYLLARMWLPFSKQQGRLKIWDWPQGDS